MSSNNVNGENIFNYYNQKFIINPLNAELNPTCHLLAFLGAHHILHISRIWVNITKVYITMYNTYSYMF
jgi:hypothetical protein